MLQGVYTALTTPFLSDGTIDFSSLEKQIEIQISAGVQGLVLLGTTAETATLTAQEKKELLDFCTKQINNRVKIVIGTGTNSTASTLENTRVALAYHPEAVLVVTPYYNKPNFSGLTEHYKQVAALGTPIVLYHIPGRTGLKLPTAFFEKLLAQVPQIKGIKESDYDMAHVTDMAVNYAEKRISYICGNDDLFPHYLALNASGIISAAANVLAPAFVKIYKNFQEGKTREAFAVFSHIYPLIKGCYLETNPTCVKYISAKLGFGTDTVRLPLGAISAENAAKIDKLLEQTDKNLLIH